MKRRSVLYWPGLCVAGLCIGAGVRNLGPAPVAGVFLILIGVTLAHLTMEANA